jgi:hypothetical protein
MLIVPNEGGRLVMSSRWHVAPSGPCPHLSYMILPLVASQYSSRWHSPTRTPPYHKPLIADPFNATSDNVAHLQRSHFRASLAASANNVRKKRRIGYLGYGTTWWHWRHSSHPRSQMRLPNFLLFKINTLFMILEMLRRFYMKKSGRRKTSRNLGRYQERA